MRRASGSRSAPRLRVPARRLYAPLRPAALRAAAAPLALAAALLLPPGTPHHPAAPNPAPPAASAVPGPPPPAAPPAPPAAPPAAPAPTADPAGAVEQHPPATTAPHGGHVMRLLPLGIGMTLLGLGLAFLALRIRRG